jgi:glycosyltransferase involved in cell wall biosynthesis
MVRKVYFEPSGRIHPAQWLIIKYPPDGFEFVVGNDLWDKGVSAIIRNNLIYHHFFGKVLDRLLPVHLIKSRLEGIVKSAPEGVDLTYAVNHCVFRREPWIVFLECVTAPAGFTLARLQKRRRIIERLFASSYCKKILVWYELTRRSVLVNLNCESFEEKITQVPLAVPRKDFAKKYQDDKVTLLFLGTANAPGAFEQRGGREVLEAFSHLAQRYQNLELVVRSDVPRPIKGKYHARPGIRFVEDVMPQELLEELFRSADIFLLPSYYTSWAAIPEAMSYELPVVTTDAYANPEIVKDGVTGFIIPMSTIPRWSQTFLPPNTAKDPQYERASQKPDPQIVEELVKRVRILIENPELRRRMGKAGRQEVETGRFSISRRNEQLKRIFDEAIADSQTTSLPGRMVLG